jgi:hypothetical protein
VLATPGRAGDPCRIGTDAPVFTSKDWIEPIGQFKHHISVRDCQVLIDDNGDALITVQDPALKIKQVSKKTNARFYHFFSTEIPLT